MRRVVGEAEVDIPFGQCRRGDGPHFVRLVEARMDIPIGEWKVRSRY